MQITVARATNNVDRTWKRSANYRKTLHSWVLRYTFDKSAKKIDGRVLLAPTIRFAFSSASSNLFFLKLLTGIFPFDRWRKPLCVKGRQNYPPRSPRWLARKIFFWPISGTDFDTSGTRLVRKSAQGLFSPWNKLSRQKCRSPESIASSRLVAPGSPRMALPVSSETYKCRFTWSVAASSLLDLQDQTVYLAAL